jgi:hypothetical protein
LSWLIKCNNSDCKSETWVKNIVNLIENHTDKSGWFVCSQCNERGFIEKSFSLQEQGETWEPFLRGTLRLGDPNDTYQPFVFLVSYEPNGPANDVWFSYYKDLRSTGGRLKLGYGPGGPPVLGSQQIISLLKRLKELCIIDKEKIKEAMA